MNILSGDCYGIAVLLLAKIKRFKGDHLVYCRHDGKVQIERKTQPRLQRVGDDDLVGCYRRDSDPHLLADDLRERMKEICS